MLSKVGHENQSETISHILVQKAKSLFEKGEFAKCNEDLEDAFRFAPSVSAKILRLRLYLTTGNLDQSKNLLLELLKEHPMYTSFIFESLVGAFNGLDDVQESYHTRLDLLKDYFLALDDNELLSNASVTLTKVRLLKQSSKDLSAYEVLKKFMEINPNPSEALKTEYIKTLIQLKRYDEVVTQVDGLLENFHRSLTKHYCSNCGYNSDEIFWRCPQCHEWETIQFRWKV
jgi:lipopolysaccharide biosynthesis regulator YciM